MTGWARVRRPAGLIEGTRWLFCLAVLAAMAVLMPGALSATRPSELPVLLVATGVLVGGWVYRYLARRAPVLLDVLEVVVTIVLGVVLPDPAMVLAFAFPSLWFRALYGSTLRFALFGVGVAGSVVAAVLLWPVLPGREGLESVAAVIASTPVILLTTWIARHLGLGLIAREQSQRRDAALVGLGNALIGTTDRATIVARADDCAEALCAATPGLRILVLSTTREDMRVDALAGPFRLRPETIPADLLPRDADPGSARPVRDGGLLSRAAGLDRAAAVEWLCLPLAAIPGGWLVAGAPRRVPAEAIVSVQSMINQVALAVRTSEAHHDLTTQAHTDALTGLANRSSFTAALEQALAEQSLDQPGRRPALLFLDLDDFKNVNDGLGHAAGDELLRHVAARLRWATRPEDLCARLGGDEFAVLLPDADDTAAAVAQRLVELVATPVSLTGRLAQVGASVGLAFAAPGMPAEQLVHRADVAMYAAKAKGKNRVQAYDPSLLQDDGHAAFEAQLAAAADAGQLVVHYQPIVSVADGRCVAVEALVRWLHPSRGLLAPAEFIATAERTGAIVGIGAHVLRRACSDVAAWSRYGGPLAVHVNVSAAQLTDPGFADAVRACTVDFALAPKQLVLEITESMVLDSPAIRVALEQLIALGVAVAIDDFGTGYSALSTIRTLPLDIIKLDKSFIAGGPSHAADEAVVGAIVAMAGRLGLQIVAEGVERVDQQQFLVDVGADAAQGYLHLRPAPAADVAAWLHQRRGAGRRPGSNVTSIGPRRTG